MKARPVTSAENDVPQSKESIRPAVATNGTSFILQNSFQTNYAPVRKAYAKKVSLVYTDKTKTVNTRNGSEIL
jgi:hypothetical protein